MTGLTEVCVTSVAIDNAPVAMAHHEAGHTLLYYLLRGAFSDEAVMSHTNFDSKVPPGGCRNGLPFLGSPCGENYCLHDVWEYLGGPVSEWCFRAEYETSLPNLFEWLQRLSDLSLRELAPNRQESDDLTSALRDYCYICLNASNTSRPTEPDAWHSNEHALAALWNECQAVQSILRSRNLSTRVRQRWFEFSESPRRRSTPALVG
jgi:hypothetical protein